MPAIEKGHKKNFDTLLLAAKRNHLALADCRDKKTGKPVRVICTVLFDGSEYVFTPLAKMFDGEPYEELDPPGYDLPGEQVMRVEYDPEKDGGN